MRTLVVSACLLVLVPGRGQSAPPEDGARALLERAVKALGGEERLARNRAERGKRRGTLFIRDRPTPFVADTLVQLPAQYKSIIELSADGQKHLLVHIINGDKMTVTLDGQPQEVGAAALAEMRATMHLQRVSRLLPLLKEGTYQLALLEEVKVHERPALPIRVSQKGNRDITLFFDKETALLVKSEHALDDGHGKEIVQEEHYGDFKEVSGRQQATKVVVYRAGKKVMESVLVEVSYPEKIDEAEFTRP
jgi:hypothetical protein